MSDKVAKLERLIGDMLAAQNRQERQNIELLRALMSLRRLVKEGGVPRYTVTPGAALNAVIEEVVDPAIKRSGGLT